MSDKIFLILGGGGLVGMQVARRIASDLAPSRIIVAALYEGEVKDAVAILREAYAHTSIEFEGVWGNIFVRSEFSNKSRRWLLADKEQREKMYQDLLGTPDDAYQGSRMVEIVNEYQPDVIVDAINTATAISYQDVYTASRQAKKQVDMAFSQADSDHSEAERAFETLIISQAIPQLVRHVTLLNRSMREVGTRLYVKIGTTGTGGMGLNIPYTHGEDKPSATLMSKTAVAFAHTGLLFLMARTVGGAIVKEVKPGAMIGYADVTTRAIREHGQNMGVFNSRVDKLVGKLVIRSEKGEFEEKGDLILPVVDTGENGLFTRGEFEAITSLRQMEFITPEEIAREVVHEIRGSNTGQDVISAINSSVMNPTYRAGYLRQQALDELINLEAQNSTHSVALGQLGPPQLSKLLWEAELLRVRYGTLQAVLDESVEVISAEIHHLITHDADICQTITSIGLPILTPDGGELIRGPFIRIPEMAGNTPVDVPIEGDDIDLWAKKGWVDLRSPNFTVWQNRFQLMVQAQQAMRMRGSAAITREGYLYDDIRIGTIVGWIFNNEQDGYRIK